VDNCPRSGRKSSLAAEYRPHASIRVDLCTQGKFYIAITTTVPSHSFYCILHSFRVWSLILLYSFDLYSLIPHPLYLHNDTLPANMKSTVIAFAFFAATFGAPTRRQTGNLQTFTGALGGIAATPVQNTGDAKRPFQVKGDTFVNLSGALARSCDQQFNACANAANGGDKTLSTAQCTSQKGTLERRAEDYDID
jgi:hypothetical protein